MLMSALTTIDNPYDPFDEFDQWLKYDNEKGYGSCAYLDRVAKTSDLLTDEENAAIIESAIDEIIQLDPFGVYKKVKKDINEQTFKDLDLNENNKDT